MDKKIKIAVGLILVACLMCVGLNLYNQSSNKSTDNKIVSFSKDSKEKNIILNVSSEFDSIYDNSNTTELENRSDLIVIGKIKSVDGAINYNEKTNEYIMTSTIGTVKVDTIIKSNGVVLSGDVIKFARLGGVISVDEYIKTLEPRQITRQGLDMLTEEEKKNSYVKDMPKDDIEPEEGKTYLMYMEYDEDLNRYFIIGMEYGLKEYNKVTNKVKNNLTNKWERNPYSDR